jgi:hypothetical protein
VSRRTAVAGLAGLTGTLAGTLTGCTASSLEPGLPAAPSPTAGPGARPTGSPTRDHDVRLAARVLAGEQAMLDRVLATLRRHPGLAAALAAARQGHREHVDVLVAAVPAGARTPRTAARPRPVPGGPGAALSSLAGAEDRLARLRARDALTARSGPFARVLASMAAAAAQQGALLAGAAQDRR